MEMTRLLRAETRGLSLGWPLETSGAGGGAGFYCFKDDIELGFLNRTRQLESAAVREIGVVTFAQQDEGRDRRAKVFLEIAPL
jgi:hypothetical protein